MPFYLALAAIMGALLAWLIWRRPVHRCARCHSPMPADYGDPLCLVCRLDDEPVITALAPASPPSEVERLLTYLDDRG